MGRPLKIAKGSFIDTGIPSQTETGNIGIVGGENPTGLTLKVYANIQYAQNGFAEGDSFIVRQKGSSKYLVANIASPSIQGICYLTNVTGTSVASITAGQMAVIATDASAANVTLGKIENTFVIAYADQTANAGPKTDISLGQPYWGSFIAANATPQSGSAGGSDGGADGGGQAGGGLYPIVLLPSF
jgi:hypothetical protein